MSSRVNSGHGADIIHFAHIARHSDRSDNLPGGIPDQLTARLKEHGPVGQVH